MTQRDETEHPVDQEIESIGVVYSETGQGDIRVWKGDVAVAEFCQHAIVGVYFREPA